MKKIFALLVILLAFIIPSPTSASAATVETSVMEGTIGKYGVKMKLFFNETTHSITGWYYYKSKGPKNKINLTGTFQGEATNASNVNIVEKVNGKVTGTFRGDFGLTRQMGMLFWELDGSFTNSKGKRFNVQIVGERY